MTESEAILTILFYLVGTTLPLTEREPESETSPKTTIEGLGTGVVVGAKSLLMSCPKGTTTVACPTLIETTPSFVSKQERL